MATRQPFSFPSGAFIGLASFVVFPALWSLGSAIFSALSTGEVLVISLGRYETSQRMVPWTQGWSRFVGPPLLVLSLMIAGRGTETGRRLWVGVALAVVGLAMLFFSSWFVTLAGVASFAGVNAFIVLCFYIDGWFGRAAAFWFMLGAVLLAVLLYAPR